MLVVDDPVDELLGVVWCVVVVVLDEVEGAGAVVLVVELTEPDDVVVVCRPEPGERLVPATCVLPFVSMTCFAADGTACCAMCSSVELDVSFVSNPSML